MKLIPAKTPEFVKSLFPNFTWNINTQKQELYLTFDDGPTPEITPWVLEQLKQYDAKATFFCIGCNIEKYPEIFEMIINQGHSVGNHTYNHLKGWKHNTKDYLVDVKNTQDIIASKTDSLFFRPPYGKFKTKQAKQLQKLGYKVIMWDVLSFDWSNKVSKEDCFDNIINATQKGSIIVMHDSVKAEQNLKYALPKVLEYYNEKGFKFKSILPED